MLRQVLRGSARMAAAVKTASFPVSQPAMVCRASTILAANPEFFQLNQHRLYSAKQPLSVKTVEERIKLVLSLYDKINPNNLTMDSDFFKDLGLDSLDHVEIVMAMEDEFNFEIPDGDSDKFKTPRDIFRYICDKEDVYE